MFDKWMIYEVKATGERVRFYAEDLEEVLDDQGLTREDVELVPISEATPQELAELIGDEAENANYHEFTRLAEEIYEGLKAKGFSEDDQAKVLWIVAESVGSMF